MRRIVKAYVVCSSVCTGLIVIAALALCILYFDSPKSFESLWKGAFAEMVKGEAPANTAQTLAPARSTTLEGQQPPATAPLRPVHQDSGDDDIDISALEARLRYLESAVPPGPGTEPPAAGGLTSTCMDKLAAWESIREPLVELLNKAPRGDGEADAPPLALVGGIESLAPRMALRLKSLARRWDESSGVLARDLSPSMLARLIADESSFSNAAAVLVLLRLNSEDAREALERLARWAPRRAARLLEQVTDGGGSWKNALPDGTQDAVSREGSRQ